MRHSTHESSSESAWMSTPLLPPASPLIDSQVAAETALPNSGTSSYSFHAFWRLLRRKKAAFAGLFVFLLIVLVAILAPLIAPHHPLQQNLGDNFKPPMLSLIHI